MTTSANPGPRQLLSRLRSYFIFDPLIFGYTAVFGALSLLSSFFDDDGRMQHWFARRWSRMILATAMSPVEVIHGDTLKSVGPCVVVSNHLSAMDVPVLYTQLPFQFRIVAKKELFHYPFMGWHLRRSGQIPIDASSPRATFKSLTSAIDDFRRGLSVVIFPEGGRSPSGEVQPFMNGAFYLAIKAHVPVLPVAIVGTYEMLPMNTFHIKPRRLKFVVGHPLPTEGLTLHDIEALSAQAKKSLEEFYYANAELLPASRDERTAQQVEQSSE